MIEELTKYISLVQEEHPLADFVKSVPDGLHITVRVVEDEPKVERAILSRKGKIDLSPQDEEYLLREVLPREMHTGYIESNKAIADKKIHSASPYAIKFKKQILPEKKDEDRNKTEREKKEAWLCDWNEHVQNYFSKAVEKTNTDLSDDQKILLDTFSTWCGSEFRKWLEEQELYTALKSGEYIIVYLLNFIPREFEMAHENYLQDNLFNTSSYNRRVGDKTYGLSNFFNGDNSKKPFLQHQSAPFSINARITKDTSLKLHMFDLYRKAGAFRTNPLPIFIQRYELNNEVINTLKQDGKNISFHGLLKRLFTNQDSDLGNYYLLYILRGEIKDVDFVSAFRYKIEEADIHKIFSTQGGVQKIRDVFSFEHEVVQVIFNNQVVQKRGKDKGIRYRYFDEVKNNPTYITDTTWHLIMEYRKAFYDFIYKSRREAVTNHMFHDIMQKGVLDDLRHDELKNDRHTKTTDIYRKLNIWFSLWNFFGNTSNPPNMASKIKQLQERMREIREPNSSDVHIENDEEFAFVAGQVIFFLVSKSKSTNLTHSVLEPFLQKSKAEELKKAIAHTFNAYKHEIDLYRKGGRFEKLCSEVMGYDYNGDVKELMPMILAGYFSPSSIYETSDKKTNKKPRQ